MVLGIGTAGSLFRSVSLGFLSLFGLVCHSGVFISIGVPLDLFLVRWGGSDADFIVCLGASISCFLDLFESSLRLVDVAARYYFWFR
jgi:hypothetical protein